MQARAVIKASSFLTAYEQLRYRVLQSIVSVRTETLFPTGAAKTYERFVSYGGMTGDLCQNPPPDS